MSHNVISKAATTGSKIPRRQALGLFGTAVGAALGAGVLARAGSQSAAAIPVSVTLNAADVSLESDDGSITGLTVAPNVDVKWSGFDVLPTKVETVVTVINPETLMPVAFAPYITTLSDAQQKTSNTVNVQMPTYQLLNTPVFMPEHFNSATDGASVIKSVEVHVEARVHYPVTTTTTQDVPSEEYQKYAECDPTHALYNPNYCSMLYGWHPGTTATNTTKYESSTGVATYKVTVKNTPKSATITGDVKTGGSTAPQTA